MKTYHNRDHAFSELTDEAEDRAKFLNDLSKAQGLKAAQEGAKGDPRVAFEAHFKFFYARPDYVLMQVDKLFPK